MYEPTSPIYHKSERGAKARKRKRLHLKGITDLQALSIRLSLTSDCFFYFTCTFFFRYSNARLPRKRDARRFAETLTTPFSPANIHFFSSLRARVPMCASLPKHKKEIKRCGEGSDWRGRTSEKKERRRPERRKKKIVVQRKRRRVPSSRVASSRLRNIKRPCAVSVVCNVQCARLCIAGGLLRSLVCSALASQSSRRHFDVAFDCTCLLSAAVEWSLQNGAPSAGCELHASEHNVY